MSSRNKRHPYRGTRRRKDIKCYPHTWRTSINDQHDNRAQLRSASITVCDNARDATDARDLLEMIGLIPPGKYGYSG